MNYINNYDYLFKILLIGDSGVGKSSIVLRFIDDTYTDRYISTIGVDFKIKTININNKIIKLQIWDTAGQERFRTITTSYYRGAHGIIVVFDLNNIISLENIDQWFDNISKYGNENIQKILVGNKSDIERDKNISQFKLQQIINKYDLIYIETSARNNTNINNIFDELALSLLNKIHNINYQISNSLIINNNSLKIKLIDNKKNSQCC